MEWQPDQGEIILSDLPHSTTVFSFLQATGSRLVTKICGFTPNLAISRPGNKVVEVRATGTLDERRAANRRVVNRRVLYDITNTGQNCSETSGCFGRLHNSTGGWRSDDYLDYKYKKIG